MQPKRRSHLNVLLPLLAAIVVMLALVAAAPTLYRLLSAPRNHVGAAPSAHSAPAAPPAHS